MGYSTYKESIHGLEPGMGIVYPTLHVQNRTKQRIDSTSGARFSKSRDDLSVRLTGYSTYEESIHRPEPGMGIVY
ncbi:hypothetical protein Taro_003177 [Colocasia esculenta]|uniref:Uncharacterized protein n=1 Tax=Colocasia esculenta TaxID=4460 RepID=A0A843TR21_COLES|nr:hypothetical protein [Colocasia esculenta]